MSRAAAAVAASLAVLSGCTTPTMPTAVPEGVAVSVYQNRVDVGNRKLSVSFQNDTGGPLTITRLEFSSAQFAAPAVWPKESTEIADGTIISLAVPLPEANCSASRPVPQVEFDYRLADGRAGTAVAEPIDTLGRLPQIFTEDCVAASVGRVVTVEATSLPRDAIVGSRLVTEIDLSLTPTGAPGTVVFEQAAGTTLLTPVDQAGIPVAVMPLNIRVGGSDQASVLTLVYAPGRCDPHAIAEDKRGTVFALSVVTSDGLRGIIYVTSAERVKVALYDFARRACGLAD